MYIKGNLIGSLQKTLEEKTINRNSNKPISYKWVTVLALLDEEDHWLFSESWKVTESKKAHVTLLQEGWTFKEFEDILIPYKKGKYDKE